ncbi:PACE efflux transporter [Aliiroseovarius sp. KMU-50]|uniref:PACE efflux transporter n=1 Tax=Aliiroseovarius salicola TaxID=3009082 RepID=A0ABT4W447_9RHOB|nr:PACE efflux transporter [Aliiroseovarius sp. KMU-50]MDA5095293.1 PACE efflux transporter [Aliiroseovarius sp. KMU-50]
MPIKMTFKERLLHTTLFEAIALATFVPLSVWITGHQPHLMLGLSVTMSVIAMLWNLAYNWGFDHAFGFDRLSRGLTLRLVHSLLFEVGLVTVSLPLLMVLLDLGFWAALMFDIAAVIYFLIYAVIFNWSFDVLRDRWLQHRAARGAAEA